MFYPTAIFFPLIISVIATGGALLMLAVSHLKMLKKYNLLLKEENHLKHEHKKELEILEDARKKAAKIIGDAHFVDNNAKNQFQEQLKTVSLNAIKDFEKTSGDFLKAYRKELEDLKLNTVKIVNSITKDIESDTLSELKDFKEILKKETYASQKIVEQKIEKDYEEAKKAIDAYKAEKIKVIEDDIYKVLQTVSVLVLGKALSLQDHENLIIDALNQAKRERII